MMKKKCSVRGPLCLAVMLCLWASSSGAALMEQVQIHGFGGWAYGKTDNENRYLSGREDGNYEHVDLSLNISATPAEHLSLHVQPSFREDFRGDETGLDYAFVEWFWSDLLRVRVGKVKAPFMMYTEIYDVGTVRPFFFLPQGVYQEFAAESYKGIGLTGRMTLGRGWECSYDLYGGKLATFSFDITSAQGVGFDVLEPQIDEMIGGRLTLETPLEGFSVSIASYTGSATFLLNGEPYADLPQDLGTTLTGLSAEYLSDRWDARGEYLWHCEEDSDDGTDSGYVELAYQVTSHWQVALRYEVFNFDYASQGLQFLPESFFEHEEIAVGLNYWLNPNLVLKGSFHHVTGNRYANPDCSEDLQAAIQRGKFDEPTNLLLFGVQFSF